MGGRSSFVKQAAILAAAGIIVRILGFLYRVPLTNMIGDEGNGIYSAGYYIYTFFLVMSSAGLPAAISKMVSEKISVRQYYAAHRIFKVSLLCAAVLGMAGSLFMYFGAEWFCGIIQSPRSYYSLVTLAPTIFIVAVMSVFRGYFQGMNTTVPTALSQVVEQVFNAVFSVYLAYVFMKKGVEYGAAGGTAGTGIGAAVGLIFIAFVYMLLKHDIIKKTKRDKRFYKEEKTGRIALNLLMVAVPIITGTAIFSMTNLIDMKMVNQRLAASGSFTTKEIDALYGQLTGKYVTLTTLPVSISTAFATAVLPSIAASVALKKKQELKNKIDTTLRITMIISIPAGIGMGALGSQILKMLYPNYPDGGMLLKVGAISVIFLALSQIATGILQGLGKVYVPAVNALIGALIKIPLNYILISIPEINVLGAVISTIVCYAVASILNIIALVKTTKVTPDFKGMFIKPMAASICMGLACYVVYYGIYMIIPYNTFATLFAIVIAMIVYLFIMLMLKGILIEDLKLVPFGNKLIRLFQRFGLI